MVKLNPKNIFDYFYFSENLLKYDFTRLKSEEMVSHLDNNDLNYLKIVLENNGKKTEGMPNPHPIFYLTKWVWFIY